MRITRNDGVVVCASRGRKRTARKNGALLVGVVISAFVVSSLMLMGIRMRIRMLVHVNRFHQLSFGVVVVVDFH